MSRQRKTISICMVSMGFPPEYTGAGRQALTLAKRLIERINLFVVSVRSGSQKKIEDVEGINLIRIKTLGKDDKLRTRKVIFCLNLFWFLLLHKNDYDIIHCIGGGFFLIPAFIVAKLLGKKICVKLTRAAYKETDHELTKLSGDDPDAMRKRLSGRLVFQALKRCDAIVCISQQLYDICRTNCIDAKRLFSIPNGVDTDFFKPINKEERFKIRKQFGLPINSLIACFVGNTRKAKRIDLIIDATAKVVSYYTKFLLIIVGPRVNVSNKYSAFVDNLICKNNMMSNIRFTGFQSPNIVRRYLQASDMYLFSSIIEGQPNSVIEAMACGLSCVAAYSPAIEQLIIDGQDGLIFNQENKNEFQKKICLLIENRDIRNVLGKEARKKIIEKFDINLIAEQYLRLYRKLLIAG